MTSLVAMNIECIGEMKERKKNMQWRMIHFDALSRMSRQNRLHV